MIQLKLYLANHSPQTRDRIHRLRGLLDDLVGKKYHLDVVDILDNPSEAVTDDVIATPTLIRQRPEPERRVVGDLSNWEMIRKGLSLSDGNSRQEN